MKRRHMIAAATGGAAALALPASARADADVQGGHGRRVRTGFEVLAADGYAALKGQKVGIISNPTGITRDLRHVVDVMTSTTAGKVNLVAVFGPEHGFRGTSQAGHGEEFFIDPKTRLPVYNAYNDKDKLAEFFTKTGLDTVVFDIQDVGARFYTYIWTMYLAMEAAARIGKRFVVLDRPNPITGRAAHGPILHPEHATFVGLKPISQQHGMTVGELARLFNTEFVAPTVGRPVDLRVIELRGWSRDMWFDETGLPWVPPSPNMPTVRTATAYPGTCLFEATYLSEGRGTTTPFSVIGAPHLDHRWEEALNALRLPGVQFREAYFKPTFSKHLNVTCGGVEVFVTDRDRFDQIRTAIAMLITAKALQPADKPFWRETKPPYWIDKLTGSDGVRLAIDAGKSVDEVVAGWQAELTAFRKTREKYLIYRKGGH